MYISLRMLIVIIFCLGQLVPAGLSWAEEDQFSGKIDEINMNQLYEHGSNWIIRSIYNPQNSDNASQNAAMMNEMDNNITKNTENAAQEMEINTLELKHISSNESQSDPVTPSQVIENKDNLGLESGVDIKKETTTYTYDAEGNICGMRIHKEGVFRLGIEDGWHPVPYFATGTATIDMSYDKNGLLISSVSEYTTVHVEANIVSYNYIPNLYFNKDIDGKKVIAYNYEYYGDGHLKSVVCETTQTENGILLKHATKTQQYAYKKVTSIVWGNGKSAPSTRDYFTYTIKEDNAISMLINGVLRHTKTSQVNNSMSLPIGQTLVKPIIYDREHRENPLKAGKSVTENVTPRNNEHGPNMFRHDNPLKQVMVKRGKLDPTGAAKNTTDNGAKGNKDIESNLPKTYTGSPVEGESRPDQGQRVGAFGKDSLGDGAAIEIDDAAIGKDLEELQNKQNRTETEEYAYEVLKTVVDLLDSLEQRDIDNIKAAVYVVVSAEKMQDVYEGTDLAPLKKALEELAGAAKAFPEEMKQIEGIYLKELYELLMNDMSVWWDRDAINPTAYFNNDRQQVVDYAIATLNNIKTRDKGALEEKELAMKAGAIIKKKDGLYMTRLILPKKECREKFQASIQRFSGEVDPVLDNARLSSVDDGENELEAFLVLPRK